MLRTRPRLRARHPLGKRRGHTLGNNGEHPRFLKLGTLIVLYFQGYRSRLIGDKAQGEIGIGCDGRAQGEGSDHPAAIDDPKGGEDVPRNPCAVLPDAIARFHGVLQQKAQGDHAPRPGLVGEREAHGKA